MARIPHLCRLPTISAAINQFFGDKVTLSCMGEQVEGAEKGVQRKEVAEEKHVTVAELTYSYLV